RATASTWQERALDPLRGCLPRCTSAAMVTGRDTVGKLTGAVGLMFAGVLALVVLLWRAAGVVASSDDSIAGDYSPSIVALDSMLGDIQRLQHLVTVTERARRPIETPGEKAEIAAVRAELERDGRTYRELPIDPGEGPLIDAVSSSMQ